MDQKYDRETKLILKKNIPKIKKEIEPEKIILFGSRARGDNLKSSDFDMIIISKYFNKLNWRERIVKILNIWDNKIPIEPICLTPNEFENRKNELSIIGKAVKEGIIIYNNV